MDQDRHDIALRIGETPAEIRAEMAATRRSLSRNLHALKDHLLHPFSQPITSKDPVMPTKTKSVTVKKSRKSEAEPKSKASSRSEGARADSKSATPSKSGTNGADKQNGAAKSTGAAKASSSSKKEGAAGRKGPDARKTSRSSTKTAASRSGAGKKSKAAQGLVAKTGEVLDPMVAGALVGAITGAARNLAGEATAVPLCEPDESGQPANASRLVSGPAGGSEVPTTGKVLGELASGAALGAISGAAKAAMTESGLASGGAKKKPKTRK